MQCSYVDYGFECVLSGNKQEFASKKHFQIKINSKIRDKPCPISVQNRKIFYFKGTLCLLGNSRFHTKIVEMCHGATIAPLKTSQEPADISFILFDPTNYLVVCTDFE